MSIVNISNLTLNMQKKIGSNSEEIDLLTYAKVIEKLKTGAVCSTDSYNNLPLFSENIGSMYFVESDQTVYFANREVGWLPLKNQSYTEMYSWGCNQGSVLITGNCLNYSSPVREICSDTSWCYVTSLNIGASGLKTDGSLWAWGRTCGESFTNQAGPFTSIQSPVREITSSTWAQVKRGGDLAHAIKINGTLWGSGYNLTGDVGDGTALNRSSPVQEASSSSNWSYVASPGGIKSDGTLWMWGPNIAGQVGVNDVISYSSPVQEASSSLNWSVLASKGWPNKHAIKTDGTLWSWGCGTAGQLAVNNISNYSSPVQEISSSINWCLVNAGTSQGLGIKTDGTLWLWGCGIQTFLASGAAVLTSSPVQEISSSSNWILADTNCDYGSGVKTDGSLWGWGRNNCGAIGDGTVFNRTSPVQEVTSSTDWYWVSPSGRATTAIKQKSI